MDTFAKIRGALHGRASRKTDHSEEKPPDRFGAVIGRLQWLIGWLAPSLKFRAGVDIGSRSASCVILERGRSRWALRSSSSMEYSPEQKNDVVGELVRQLEMDLREIVGRWSCRDVPVYLAMSGKNEVVKRVVMPSMKSRELREALLLRFERETLSSPQGVSMGYLVERERTDGEDRFLEITVSVVNTDTLEEYMEPLEAAGFTDIRPVAASLTYRDALVFDEPFLLLDMGHDRTGFYATVPGTTALYREVGIGGSSLTDALTGRFSYSKGVLELTGDRAERLKKKYGVSSERVESDEAAEEACEHIPEILKNELDKLVVEIRRTVQYMKSTLGSTPARIFLSGGGSSLPDIVPHLQGILGIEVKRLDYGETALATDPDKAPSSAAPLLSLAVGAALCPGQQGRVTSPAYRVRRLLNLERRIFRYAVATVAGAIVGYSSLTQGITGKTKIDSVLMNYSTIMATDLGTKARDLDEEKRRLNQLEEFLSIDPPSGPDMVTMLREFSHIVPDYVIFTEFEILSDDTGRVAESGRLPDLVMPGSDGTEWTGPVILIEGSIDAQPLFLEAYLSKFNRRLIESGLFENVRVVSWERSDENTENVLKFSLMCSLSPWLRGV